MKSQAPYTTLEPGTKEHKDFIANAILTRNHYQLSALRDRTLLPIHLVNNWFAYHLMRQGLRRDVVVVYSITDQDTLKGIQEARIG